VQENALAVAVQYSPYLKDFIETTIMIMIINCTLYHATEKNRIANEEINEIKSQRSFFDQIN